MYAARSGASSGFAWKKCGHGLRGRQPESIKGPWIRVAEVTMDFIKGEMLGVLLLGLVVLYGCDVGAVRDTASVLPGYQRSEVIGFLAGFGTTFAALPDLIAMLRRRSSAGLHPRILIIMGIFQIAWVYYGLLIASRPVIAWNMIAVVINFLCVGAYFYFVRSERKRTKK